MAEPRARFGRITVWHDTLLGYLRELTPANRRFWLLVPLTGALSGLAAVGAVRYLELVQWLGWGEPHDVLRGAELQPWYRRLAMPLLGGAIVLAAQALLRVPSSGHGTSTLIEAIWVRQGKVRLRWAVVQGLECLTVVGLGASLGREGALVYFGAALGSWLGRRFQLGGDQLKLLVAAGASAGIAAAYNTPIGGALFGLEVFLGGLSLELYGPLIFAAVSSTMVSRALLFDHPSFVIPHYRLEHAAELPLYLVVAVVIGALAAALVHTVEQLTRFVAALPPRRRQLLPLVALLLVGLTGIWFPQVFGNGYFAVDLALVGKLSLGLLLVLPVLKLFLSSLCAASGVPGALFTPSLFIGGLAGGACGVLSHRLFPHVAGQTGGYVLVGMCAVLAGSTHATLAAALLLFELTGSYDLILPLLAAAVVATAVSRTLAPESIYTAPLKRRGVELPRSTRPAWMQREGVRSLVQTGAPYVAQVRKDAPLDEVILAFARLPRGAELFVTDAAGRLEGAIAPDEVREALAEQPDLRLLVAADLAHEAPAISIDASLWDATRRALKEREGLLPVFSPREGGRLVGTLSIPDVLAAAARPGPADRRRPPGLR